MMTANWEAAGVDSGSRTPSDGKRQFRKGRFTITEAPSAPSSAGPAPEAPLYSIPESSSPRVVKKGRFRIWTCLGCVDSVRSFSDEHELLVQPQSVVPHAPLGKSCASECSAESESQGYPAQHCGWDCQPKLPAVHTRAQQQRQQERDQASHRGSWESSSSLLSATISTDSSTMNRPLTLLHRSKLSSCSDPGVLDTPNSSCSLPALSDQALACTASSTAAASPVSTPPTTVRCYQRGRFAVEEAVWGCCLEQPAAPVARTKSCPTQLPLLSPNTHHRHLSSPSLSCLAAAAAVVVAAPAATTAGVCATLVAPEPCTKRQQSVFYRRGRFLVQTGA